LPPASTRREISYSSASDAKCEGVELGKGECVDDGTTTDRRDIARLADNRRLACRREAEKGKADVVLRNGKIYTADPGRSMRQAIALESWCPPGLIDTHIHPIFGTFNRSKCSLAGVKATIDALKPVVQT